MTNFISVIIVEDKIEMCRQIKSLLEKTDDIKVIATFHDSRSALEKIPEYEPDIVLMDLNLPDGSGIECIKNLKPKLSKTQFVILTMFDDSELVFKGLSHGAIGYLLKRSINDELVKSIYEAYKGGSPMSTQIARMVVKSFQNNKAIDEDLLTKREWEILEQLAKGKKYKEIGETLFISVETVRSHLRKIYEKLHVHSSKEAILKYFGKNHTR